MSAILINSARDVRRLPNAADAFEKVRDLRKSDPTWQVFIDPLNAYANAAHTTNDALERLYALAHMMLTVTDTNPLTLEIHFTDMAGNEQAVSAATIMAQSRVALDNLSNEETKQ